MINYPITIEVDEDYWETSHEVIYVIKEKKKNEKS